MSQLRPHERFAIEALLSGESPILAALRQQLESVVVSGREHTGTGEYVDLEVAHAKANVLPPNLVLADVNLEVQGLPHGADTLLYVQEGQLSLLELVTAAAEWPTDPVITGLVCYKEVEVEAGSYSMEPQKCRDAATLARVLLGKRANAA